MDLRLNRKSRHFILNANQNKNFYFKFLVERLGNPFKKEITDF